MRVFPLAMALVLVSASVRAEGWASRAAPAPAVAPEATALVGHAQLPLYSFPIPWGEPTFERFRESYLSKFGRVYLTRIMARADRYLPYVLERIAHYGLPPELAFLPVIESEYSPTAVSKSGAVGLWQFMPGSVKGYGMRINEWVDERKDFVKSTEGSLRKLRDNYAMFGDWFLALAAYNSGGGTVSRAIKKEGVSDYWELCAREALPPETRLYVPKFLAAATILSYRGREGFDLAWEAPLEWKLVKPGKPVDIRLLAERVGAPVEELKSLNAELLYWITPPDDPEYRLKVPLAWADRIEETLAKPGLELMRFYLYKIAPGDTLSALSRHYSVSVDMIVKYNPGLVPSALRIGQVIVIPALNEVAPYAPAAPAPEKVNFNGTYVVKKGDTLWSIALMFGIRPDTLAAGNGLTLDSVLREGMVLKVPIIDDVKR